MEKCSKVYLTNHAAVVVKWVVKVQNQEVYETSKYPVGKSVTIDLAEVHKASPTIFEEGIQFYIKSVVDAGDDSETEVLQYEAASDRTVSFEVKGTAFKTWTNKVS